MGRIRETIENLDGQDQIAESTTELISILAELAEMKAKLLEAEIAEDLKPGNEVFERMPITHILRSQSYCHAYTSSKLTDTFETTISKSVNSFIAGGAENIIKGITSLVSTGLSAFLGDSEGSSDAYKDYAACLIGESLIRIDLRGYKRKVIVSGLETKISNILVVVGTKSAIDIKKMDASSFLAMFQETYGTLTQPKQLIKQLKLIRGIYDEFEDMERQGGFSPLTMPNPLPGKTNRERGQTY
jgi:hypothetical protein